MSTPREDRLASKLGGRLAGCPEADELQRFSDGSLDDAQGKRVEAHVRACAACSDALALLERVETGAEADAIELPADVERRSEVLIAAATGRGTAGGRKSAWPTVLQVAAGLAFVAALVVGGTRLLDRSTVNGDLGELRGNEILEPIEPSGSLSAPPAELRWRGHPSADAYRVTLLDGEMREVWTRRTEGAGAVLVLDEEARAAMGPGAYTWQVEALDRIGRTLDRSPAAYFEIAPPSR